jgi:5'(3')-deoxyribonucleotidase
MKKMVNARLKLAVDVDGVLADQCPPTLARAEDELGVRMTKADVTTWNVMVGNIPFDKLIVKYLTDPDFVKTMPVMDGAKEGMAVLRELGEVIIATSIPKEAEKPRREWLRNNFDYEGPMLNTIRTGKAALQVDMLIDDFPLNVTSFIKSDIRHRAILLSQPWNQPEVQQFTTNPTNTSIWVADDWWQIIRWANMVGGLALNARRPVTLPPLTMRRF